MAGDALAGIAWECIDLAPGEAAAPGELPRPGSDWLPAAVPGSAAGALRAAGRWRWGVDDESVLDGRDWWFRCRFPGGSEPGPWSLELGGLATLADVWLNGRHLLRSENMFLAHRIVIDELAGENELSIRCAALGPVLAGRHPRPRWKSRLVRSQSLRWYRTTLLGRVPAWSRWAAPVGPWRAVRLRSLASSALLARKLTARCEGHAGVVEVRAELGRGGGMPRRARVRVGGETAPIDLEDRGDRVAVRGTARVPGVERWWPHTHGDQPCYPVALELDDAVHELGAVGFRTLELDRRDGGFTLAVNGVPVFCRGACWGTPDAVAFTAPSEEVRASVALARSANMNMLRVTGYTAYEDEAFWDACDELGILVWQDCMFASTDPPGDPDFVAGVEYELRQVLGALGGRAALAVVCGSSETYQQAAMLGLPPERWTSPLLEERIPAIAEETVPGVPYVPSTPSGGEMPFDPDVGVSHYFGVGAYLRPLDDARRAHVRFAAECLSFATPPEPETVREVFGGADAAGHDPRWKLAVTRDSRMSWDFEDVRDFYVRQIFGVDPLELRYVDPDRALDLGRAAVTEAMTSVIAEWRRESSSCAGALVLTWQDLWPGAGWGLLDSLGRPKSPWYGLRRAFSPLAVLLVDEGLSGLRVHVVNDAAVPFRGRVELTVFAARGTALEHAVRDTEVPARGALELRADTLLGGFRDLGRAYRFSPSSHDVVLVELRDEEDRAIAEAVYLPSGPARPQLPELGLAARLVSDGDGGWSVDVSTERFAQYVALDLPGFRPADSWFHLAPGRSRTVPLAASDLSRGPAGTVRALNSEAVVSLREGA